MNDEIASIARIITPIAKKYDVERVWLFGSRARGDAGFKSDYDFIISNGGIKSLFTLASFLTDLENALQSPVDLIPDTSSDKEFLSEIRKDETLLYERQR